MGELTGTVTDILRCSVHDGPGLRTTVFLKGCQLHCPWCHNPETISREIETLYYPEKCIGCRQCANGCFSGARVICGRELNVGAVMAEVMQDEPYYGADGGITVSGGEPLCQTEFTVALLDAGRAAGISAALETNLCVPRETAEPVLKKADLLMADLKLWDSAEHKRVTGRGNAQVKENLWLASSLGLPIILRTPVVPGVTDDPESIKRIAGFAAALPTLRYYELLAYHPLGVGKAEALGKKQPRFEQPEKERMEELAALAALEGVTVLVNGRKTA